MGLRRCWPSALTASEVCPRGDVHTWGVGSLRDRCTCLVQACADKKTLALSYRYASMQKYGSEVGCIYIHATLKTLSTMLRAFYMAHFLPTYSRGHTSCHATHCCHVSVSWGTKDMRPYVLPCDPLLPCDCVMGHRNENSPSKAIRPRLGVPVAIASRSLRDWPRGLFS